MVFVVIKPKQQPKRISMILAVTMNPSVDISYPVDRFKFDDVNRVETVRKTAGGKGLNVARVIAQMEEEVLSTGVLGGTIGDYIVQELNKSNIPNDFLKIKNESRNCIAIIHEGMQTEILESGPTLSKEEGTAFLEKFECLLTTEVFQGIEWIVVSMGDKGAFVRHGDDYYQVTIPKIDVVNPEGSGDATVAGLAVALNRNQKVESVLKTAMTTGMLNTMEAVTGFININKFKQYFDLVKVEKID